ncbi:hypothetical protein GSI_08772 [Ganoderma sinense ZZ0214-1]|uniref:Uncharacterized protein n=1 Tax=Ganoderma sinense ZZ0214-1 TaxID=1077348 RepID=A0A2G8S5A6_9APHY|nr:hypothetical protein GSI_08772 [Ganoderma sinense ZZ0214-1]
MELGNDMTLISLPATGAQDKLNQFSEYAANTFVLINLPKTPVLSSDPFPALSLRRDMLHHS